MNEGMAASGQSGDPVRKTDLPDHDFPGTRFVLANDRVIRYLFDSWVALFPDSDGTIRREMETHRRGTCESGKAAHRSRFEL